MRCKPSNPCRKSAIRMEKTEGCVAGAVPSVRVRDLFVPVCIDAPRGGGRARTQRDAAEDVRRLVLFAMCKILQDWQSKA